jgi:hypothetical protein
VLFARTIPLRSPWTQDDLPTLMRRSVASLAAPDADGPDLLGRLPAGSVRVQIRREGPARVDGQRAYFVSFGLRTEDPGVVARTADVTLVGVRPPRTMRVSGRVVLPTLLVFGLISSHASHGEDREALASLVRRVDFAPAH